MSTAQDIIAAAPHSVAGPDDYTGAGLINAQAAGATVTNVKDWNLY